MGPRLKAVFDAAWDEMERLKDEYCSTEHLLVAIAQDTEGAAGRILRQAGVTHVFGYPGESLVDFIEVARLDGPEVVSAVREASAAFMAEGAAMRTGTVGACLSTLGFAMFFGDPRAAFTNIGRALAPHGRLLMVAWQGQIPDELRNPSMNTKTAVRILDLARDRIVRIGGLGSTGQ